MRCGLIDVLGRLIYFVDFIGEEFRKCVFGVGGW